MMVDPLRQRRRNVPRSITNSDTNDWELVLSKGDRIQIPNSNIQFQVNCLIGKGQFGSVYNVTNLSNHRRYALKIINSTNECVQSGLSEIKILTEIKEKQSHCNSKHIVGFYGSFTFQGHICIIMEKLSYSLLEVLEKRNQKGLPLQYVRVILQDLVNALSVLDELDLMHLDIKPENVLMENQSSIHVKLADVGASEHVGQTKCKYSITRYYRPPEIVLKCGMSKKADIWSLGTLIAELYLGHVLLNASNEKELLTLIEKVLDTRIPKELIESSPVADKFFDEKGNLLDADTSNDGQTLKEIIDNNALPFGFTGELLENEIRMRKTFADLLKNMIEPNPEKRFSLQDVINHPFLTD